VSQAIRGATAHAPAAARRMGSKADLDGLRDRMRGLGFGHDEIAAEVSRRYQVRPADPASVASSVVEAVIRAMSCLRPAATGGGGHG
jgi:hypothetical protein